MRYHELEPHPDLADYVLCYWSFEADTLPTVPYMHHVMPDGCVSMVYTTQTPEPDMGIMMNGPRLQEIQVPIFPENRWWGVRFWPDAIGALLHLDGPALRDYLGPAETHLPVLASQLSTALSVCQTAQEAAGALDTAFLSLLPNVTPLDKIVRRGVEAIVASRGQIPVHQLASHLCLSERQFQRRFRKAVGLTPKQFARIRRFRSSVGTMLEETPDPWSSVAAEYGFSDQAHLIREFSDLVGLSPTTFKERIQAIEHENVTP